MLKKILLLSVLVFMSCEGEDGVAGDQGVQGEQGPMGIQGLNEPVIESFFSIDEDFENEIEINITQQNTFNQAAWTVQRFEVPFSNTELNEQLGINNSSISNDIGFANFSNTTNNAVTNNANLISETNIFVSGNVSRNQSSAINITFDNIEQRSVLLFDAYVSSDRFDDFLFWGLNGERINGISGTRFDDQGFPMLVGPYKVAIELIPEITNTLTVSYEKSNFSSSTGFDLGGIDNIQVIDVDSYLESLEDFRDQNQEVSFDLKELSLDSNIALFSKK